MKEIVTIITFLMSLTLCAQTDMDQEPEKNKFFRTYEDYKNNQPLEGYTIDRNTPWDLQVIGTDGKKRAMKYSEVPTEWFTDENGTLLRMFDDSPYYVLVNGPLCYYINRCEIDLLCFADGSCNLSQQKTTAFMPYDFYSESLKGEIKKLKKAQLDQFLTKYGLLEAYKKEYPKREREDCVLCYQAKFIKRNIRYFRLMNEKFKKSNQ